MDVQSHGLLNRAGAEAPTAGRPIEDLVLTSPNPPPNRTQLRTAAHTRIMSFSGMPPERGILREIMNLGLGSGRHVWRIGRKSVTTLTLKAVLAQLYMNMAGAYGTIRNITNETLAADVGVSRATVTRALRILNEIQLLNTVPGYGNASAQTHTIMVGSLTFLDFCKMCSEEKTAEAKNPQQARPAKKRTLPASRMPQPAEFRKPEPNAETVRETSNATTANADNSGQQAHENAAPSTEPEPAPTPTPKRTDPEPPTEEQPALTLKERTTQYWSRVSGRGMDQPGITPIRILTKPVKPKRTPAHAQLRRKDQPEPPKTDQQSYAPHSTAATPASPTTTKNGREPDQDARDASGTRKAPQEPGTPETSPTPPTARCINRHTWTWRGADGDDTCWLCNEPMLQITDFDSRHRIDEATGNRQRCKLCGVWDPPGNRGCAGPHVLVLTYADTVPQAERVRRGEC